MDMFLAMNKDISSSEQSTASYAPKILHETRLSVVPAPFEGMEKGEIVNILIFTRTELEKTKTELDKLREDYNRLLLGQKATPSTSSQLTEEERKAALGLGLTEAEYQDWKSNYYGI